MRPVATDLMYLRDAYLRDFDSVVTAVDDGGKRVALDRTAFYPTGGGQPHDTGTLAGQRVVDVRKEGDVVWHTLDGDAAGGGRHGARRGRLGSPPRPHAHPHRAARAVRGDLERVGQVPVTGGNMEPLSARMDFEFDPLPEGFGALVEELVNDELAAGRAHRGVVPAPATRGRPTKT